MNVQGRSETADLPERSYVALDCLACGGVHPVNPRTGKLMSEETRRPPPEG
jgi:translation initiation factor 2 beta subunit (eIF-2beta)/eIF-5